MLGRAVVAQGNPAKIDEVVAYVRDQVIPLVDSLPGSHGLSMFVNRDDGTIVVNSVWADQAALAASDTALEPTRREAFAILEAGKPEIHILEPAVIFQSEPDRPGFSARATEVQHPPEKVEEAVTMFRDVVLPAVREGFEGVNTIALLINRQTGYGVANITYTSREALDASRAAGERLRSEYLGRMGGELLGVRELEIAIVGIRPPVDLPAQGRPVEFPSELRR